MRKPRPGQPHPAGDKTQIRPGFRHKSRRPRPQRVEEEPAIAETMRIAKAMARAGLCSRRDAERWILDGRVTVNGEVLKSPARDVGPSDTVKVDGQPLVRPEPAMLWRFHKPRGCVTTHKDPEGRPTVFEKLPKDMPRVVSIGRLDFNTEGLLLLTTDGGLARHFELPATGWLRRYRVRANGQVSQEQLDALKEGVEIDGVHYGPIEGTVDRAQGANVWLTLGLREGKNREVRKILGSLGLEVNRLIRISFGPFQLLDLEEGTVERVKRRVLADQLGPALATQFGLDVIQPGETPGKNTGFVSKKPLPGEEKPRKPFDKRRQSDDQHDDERQPRGKHAERTPKGERFTAKPTGFGSRVLRADTGGPRKPYGDRSQPRDGAGRDERSAGKPAGFRGRDGRPDTDGPRKPFGDKRPFGGRKGYDDKTRPHGDGNRGERPAGASRDDRGRPNARPPGRPSGPPRGRPPGRRPK